jgi:hypothetical protein
MVSRPDIRVQATPDYACVFFLSQNDEYESVAYSDRS